MSINMQTLPVTISGTPSVPFNFSPLSAFNKKQKEIAKIKEPALFRAEKEEDEVKSYHYFFDSLPDIIGEKTTETTTRPKKFKKIVQIAEKDPSIFHLNEHKKALKKEMMEASERNLSKSVMEMIISFAEEKVPFDDLLLYFPELKIPLLQLQNLYEEASEASGNVLPNDLSDLVDLDTMSFSDGEIKAGYTTKARKGKLKEENWNEKGPFVQVLKECWNQNVLTLNGKQISLKAFFEKGIEDLIKREVKVDQELVTALKNKFPGVDQGKFFQIISPLMMIITNEVKIGCIAKRKTFTKAIEEMRIQAALDPLHQEILDASSILLDNNSKVGKNGVPQVSPLNVVVKEQGKHTIARFFNLLNYYTAFVNTIDHLANIAEAKEGGSRKIVFHAVDKILENCHLEFDTNNPQARKSTKPLLSKEQIEKLITIDPNKHRVTSIMGWEKEPTQTFKKIQAQQKLNLFFDAFGTENAILGFQRAHTLPFPACFSWNSEKLWKFIQEASSTSHNTPYPTKEFFHKGCFEKLANEIVGHETISSLFKEEFEKNTLSYKPQEMSEFIFSSLETIRKFYLKLFSETENLPDFVNVDLDTLSEWRDGANNYKLSLASALRSLISQGKPCTVEEVSLALVPYLTKIEEGVTKQWTLWKSKDSIPTIMKLICLYQTEHAMRVALFGHSTHITSQIFNSSILTNMAQ